MGERLNGIQEVVGSTPIVSTNLMITVYVIRGINAGKRYVGITNDLPRRLGEHRRGSSKAGQIIGEFEVLHTESFPDYQTARVREKFLKSGQGRVWLDLQYPRSRPAKDGQGCAP